MKKSVFRRRFIEMLFFLYAVIVLIFLCLLVGVSKQSHVNITSKSTFIPFTCKQQLCRLLLGSVAHFAIL